MSSSVLAKPRRPVAAPAFSPAPAWALFGATTSASFRLGAGWVILPLAGNGLVGLVLGLWWSRNEAARRSVRPRAASVAVVCLAAVVASLSPAPLVQMTVGTVLRFAPS